MKWLHTTWLVFIIFSLFGFAQAQQPEQKSEQHLAQESALVQVNVSLELDGIERSLDATKDSLNQIGMALEKISTSDNLTEQQKQVLGHTLDNLDQLVLLSRQSMEQLPSAFNQTSQKLVTTSQYFMDDLQHKVIMIALVIGLLLIIALVAIYWFVLRPLQHGLVNATTNITAMAKAIQITAQALESSTAQQHVIMQQLNQQSSLPPKDNAE
ncbi:hypothetical protein JCM19238_3679 [Vibrio ponticus]|nr:hypothetical protein JCM19238_3679 [Vibrio ponticus]